MTRLRCMAVLAALMGGFFLGQARAHEWYPWECCSDRDCTPIATSDVLEGPEGFTIKSTGEFIERSKAKVAPDDQFHICRYETSQAIICFFQPNRGV